ncbi:HTTM domain-containing protein [Leptospira sp. 'Mane']|uniref:HTTM domain-containing protein n=1 Tax=Leptospira sp. 'Mane' TaxID=3387407 RepID=UPI00398AAB90
MTVISRIFEKVPNQILIHLRMIYGLLGIVLVTRYLYNGWIEEYFLLPKMFFPHLFPIDPLPNPWPYLHAGILLLLSVLICLGINTRWVLLIFLPFFFAFHFFDRTIFLNHYYLFLLFGCLLLLSPLIKKNGTVSFLWILIFRVQILIPYFFGGIAKINSEWLFEGRPLHIWFSRFEDVPILGSYLALKETAILVSWLACIFDLTIPFFLALPATRNIAYIFAVGFHFLTGLFFPIGIFPWMMPLLGLVLFSPETHKKIAEHIYHIFPIFSRQEKHHKIKTFFMERTSILLCGFLFCFEIFLANRHWFYPGNLFWTEEGFRFSWNIMVVEKAGYAEFWMQTKEERIPIQLQDHLTEYQIRMMTYQPDMIEQFAHYLKSRYIQNNSDAQEVQIYADVFVSINGKSPRRLVKKNYDLTQAYTPIFRIPNFVLVNNYP